MWGQGMVNRDAAISPLPLGPPPGGKVAEGSEKIPRNSTVH